MLPIQPPFSFDGVSAQVFPLKANPVRLQDFCNDYLTLSDDQSVVYKPALPYAYMMVLDYGRMSSAQSKGARNIGWVGQHEVTFTVPLEIWRRQDHDRSAPLRFDDWGMVSPYIYVDDNTSLSIGREVYGWPKVAGRVNTLPSLWDSDPVAGSRVFSFSTHALPRRHEGELGLRVLLEIDVDPQPHYTTFPIETRDLWAPWNAMARMTATTLSLTQDMVDFTIGSRLRGYQTRRDADSLMRRGQRMMDNLSHLYPMAAAWNPWGALLRGLSSSDRPNHETDHTLQLTNVTLKQFRHCEIPHRACYQALVESKMGINRVNRSGLLGDLNLLRGDSSGGYSIRIHHYPGHPIVEALGLDVARTERLDGDTHASILKPTLPFWSCLLYTSPSPRDATLSRMPSSA